MIDADRFDPSQYVLLGEQSDAARVILDGLDAFPAELDEPEPEAPEPTPTPKPEPEAPEPTPTPKPATPAPPQGGA